MSNTKKLSHDEARFAEPPLHLEVLLVYEDGSTARRGKRAVDHVLSRREVMADGQFHPWRLDVLRDAACQAAATRDAVDADIIVLAIHGSNRLAPEPMDCLNDWIGLKRSRPCALVISLDAGGKPLTESNPALLQLSSEAAHCGLTVLFQYDGAPGPEMNAVIADIHRRADATTPVLEHLLHRPVAGRGWGIND